MSSIKWAPIERDDCSMDELIIYFNQKLYLKYTFVKAESSCIRIASKQLNYDLYIIIYGSIVWDNSNRKEKPIPYKSTVN